MKRMYVTLGVMFLLLFWAISSLGQKSSAPPSREEEIMKRMQIREEAHRRIVEQLMKGGTPPADMFQDLEQMMNEVMSDSFSGLDIESSFGSRSQNYSMEWSESEAGKTLAITPKTPHEQLDINVKDGFITIAGKTEIKSQRGNSVSNFKNTFNIPGECDGSKVKMDQKDGKILLHFPYKNALKKIEKIPNRERSPLPPSGEEVAI